MPLFYPNHSRSSDSDLCWWPGSPSWAQLLLSSLSSLPPLFLRLLPGNLWDSVFWLPFLSTSEGEGERAPQKSWGLGWAHVISQPTVPTEEDLSPKRSNDQAPVSLSCLQVAKQQILQAWKSLSIPDILSWQIGLSDLAAMERVTSLKIETI